MKYKACAILALASHCGLMANPSNPQVANGGIAFDQSVPGVLNVIQTTDSAIINWQDFSIDLTETTNFIQPDTSSSVLNRVMGDAVSSIVGNLNANGQVYLINPNGVIFGADTVINTASFIASTFDLPDQLFLENSDLLFAGDSQASIENYGTIKAESGDVILIGFQVINQGSIQANNGVAGLGVGQEILVRPSADERIYIRPVDYTGDQLRLGLLNAGDISALQVELKADGNPFALAINHSGTMEAYGIEEVGGRIYIVSENGDTDLSGSLLALNDNGRGGNIVVDTQNIYFYEDATITADAEYQGDGGIVELLASNSAFLCGQISARAGEISGDGGIVEVAGKYLSINGAVSTYSPAGHTGVFNVVSNDTAISGDSTVSYQSHTDGGVPTSYFSNAALGNTLELSNVFIETSFDTAIGNGDVTFTDPVSWSSPFTLSVEANADINVFTQITASDIGNIQLLAARDINVGDPSGSLTTASQLGSALGDITLGCWRNLNVVGGSTFDATAQIGYEGTIVGSDIMIPFIGGDLNVIANAAYAAIGHGSLNPVGGIKSGNITVSNLGGDVLLSAGTDNAYAMIGHYHGDAVNAVPVTASGDISFPTIEGSVSLLGGSGHGAFALIGHGGETSADGDSYLGNIAVVALTDIDLKAGSSASCFAAIGFTNGGAIDAGNATYMSESITVYSGEGLMMTGGSGENSFALIGGAAFNNNQPDTVSIAELSVEAEGDLTILGGTNVENSPSIIGTQLENGDAVANVILTASDTITITGNQGGAFVINGAGAPVTTVPYSISVKTGQGLFLNANDVADVYLQSIGSLDARVEDGDLVLSSVDGSAFIDAYIEATVSASDSIKLNSSSSSSASSITASNNDLILTVGEALILSPFSFVSNVGYTDSYLNQVADVTSTNHYDSTAVETTDAAYRIMTYPIQEGD